jgi:hypothetical protein
MTFAPRTLVPGWLAIVPRTLTPAWLARAWRQATTAPAARELDPAAWGQMQRLADACNDQAEAVGKIYDVAGVSRQQRLNLRRPR